jgi:predicted peptidase
VDEHRLYVTGVSLGGAGTWMLTGAYPEQFAAIAP